MPRRKYPALGAGLTIICSLHHSIDWAMPGLEHKPQSKGLVHRRGCQCLGSGDLCQRSALLTVWIVAVFAVNVFDSHISNRFH